MPDRTEIISAASHIEAALRNAYHTEGRMFDEMIAELHGRAPRHIIDALREVSAMRNKYAHLSDQEIERLQSAQPKPHYAHFAALLIGDYVSAANHDLIQWLDKPGHLYGNIFFWKN
jgi:hypothetical protein